RDAARLVPSRSGAGVFAVHVALAVRPSGCPLSEPRPSGSGASTPRSLTVAAPKAGDEYVRVSRPVRRTAAAPVASRQESELHHAMRVVVNQLPALGLKIGIGH